MTVDQDFSSVPVLDYALTRNPATRPEFLEQLRDALINVGFLYLSNPPVSQDDIDLVIDYASKLFTIPQEKKDKLLMRNNPHFLGYTKIGAEYTKGKADQREQYDFATPYECRWAPGAPEYLKLWGPAQWHEEEDIPGFKEAFLRYLAQCEELCYQFIDLVAEALGLARDGLRVFLDPVMQQRAKVIKYPAVSDVDSNQGVGAHFDSGFLTFLLQASSHNGLQVQNVSGSWIDVPPIPGTFVVNIGKGLEMVTYGLTRATSHRVLSPPTGSAPRYSIPFFQDISQNLRLSEIRLKFPPEVLALGEKRGTVGKTDSVNYEEYGHEYSGHVSLIGRIKSHPDVAERHYPQLFRKFFPQGMKADGGSRSGC